MKITPDQITITPGAWNQDDGPDPTWRTMTLAVTGAAPGRWTIRNNGAGWYFHLSHNGHHIGMTHWNAWDAMKVYIAHESGPYTVSIMDGNPLTGRTLTDARLAVVRIQNSGRRAWIFNADGNEITFPRYHNFEV